MKILFVGTNIGYGGASKMMVAVANHLAQEDDVTFLTFRNSDVLQPLSDNVTHVHKPLYQNKNRFLESVGQICALRKYIIQEKFDVAIAFLPPSSYMLTLAAKGTKTKVVLSERGDPAHMKKSIALKLVFQLLQMADAYVFQTEGARECYSTKAQKNSCVIPNPIPEKIIPPMWDKERKKILVNVARLDLVQKRHDVLLEGSFPHSAAKASTVFVCTKRLSATE